MLEVCSKDESSRQDDNDETKEAKRDEFANPIDPANRCHESHKITLALTDGDENLGYCRATDGLVPKRTPFGTLHACSKESHIVLAAQ